MTRQQITDQFAHFGFAFAVVWIGGTQSLIAAAIIGLACGMIRELSEAGGSRITWPEVRKHFTKGSDPWIDLAFWMLGGVAASLIFATH